jgi:hypothetical protein
MKIQVPVLMDVEVDDASSSEMVAMALEGMVIRGAVRITNGCTIIASGNHLYESVKFADKDLFKELIKKRDKK